LLCRCFSFPYQCDRRDFHSHPFRYVEYHCSGCSGQMRNLF
jgi:hypothetical protein